MDRRTKKQVRYRLPRNGDQVSLEGSRTGSIPVLTAKSGVREGEATRTKTLSLNMLHV